jgi:hypothetical protein
MKIDIQKLVEMITTEIVTQLSKMGVEIENTPAGEKRIDSFELFNNKYKVIDMNGYMSPVLTENQLLILNPEIEEIIIPTGTVITPGAKEIIRKKKIKLIYK